MPIGGALSIIANLLSEIGDNLEWASDQIPDFDGTLADLLADHEMGEHVLDFLQQGCAATNEVYELLKSDAVDSAFSVLEAFFGGGQASDDPSKDAVSAFERKLLDRLRVKLRDSHEFWAEFDAQAGEAVRFATEERDRALDAVDLLRQALCSPTEFFWRGEPARDALWEIASVAKDGAVLVADAAAPLLVPDITLITAITSARSIYTSGRRLIGKLSEWRSRGVTRAQDESHERAMRRLREHPGRGRFRLKRGPENEG